MQKLLNLSQTSIPCSVFSAFQGEFIPRTKQSKIIPSTLIPGTQLPRPATLSATKLAALHEAALDFQSASDLEHWLEKNS